MAAYRVFTGMIGLAAAIAVNAAPRTGFYSPGIAPKAPEVMLYFSHAMGTGAGARPTFGLRVQQVRQGGNSGDPDSGDVMHRKELLNWQMEAHSNLHLAEMRVQLGRRLTYDVTNNRFGSPGARSAMQLGIPTIRNAAAVSPQAKPLFARTSTPAALAPPRFTVNPASERQLARRQGGGIAAVMAAQRMQAAGMNFRNPNWQR